MRNEQRLSEEIRIWPAAFQNTEPLHHLEHDSAQSSEPCRSQGLKHRKAKRKILFSGAGRGLQPEGRNPSSPLLSVCPSASPLCSHKPPRRRNRLSLPSSDRGPLHLQLLKQRQGLATGPLPREASLVQRCRSDPTAPLHIPELVARGCLGGRAQSS